MASQHARLWLGGADWSAYTIAALEVSGGRGSKTMNPDAATVGAQILLPDTVALPRIGDRIDICGWLPGRPEADTRAALFTGTITDVALERGAGPLGEDVCSIVAADFMRQFDGVFVGDTPWPIEWWTERVTHVWDAIRSAAGNPGWMPTGSELIAQLGGTTPGMGQVMPRDVDRRRALDLLTYYLAPQGCAVYFRPSTLWPAPADPADWAPEMRIRPGLKVDIDGANPTPSGYPALIHGLDPTPRYWMNLGDFASEWKVTAVQNDVADNPTKDYLARATPDILRRYGYASQSLSTDLITSFLGTPATSPQDLADGWLDRSQYPALSVDNVRVSLRAADLAAASAAEVGESWKLVAHGPAQVARYSRWQGLPGSSQWLGTPNYEWMIEATKIVWHDDGWTIDVALAPTYLYAGGVPVSPDPRNNWAGVTQTHPTWSDVMAHHPTWADLVNTPHPNTTEAA